MNGEIQEEATTFTHSFEATAEVSAGTIIKVGITYQDYGCLLRRTNEVSPVIESARSGTIYPEQELAR